MSTDTRTFHLGDLLSVTDGHLVSPSHIDGVYSVIDFVTGQKHMTHQLPRAGRTVTPWLLGQHPWLSGIAVPDGLNSETAVLAWLEPVCRQYGERHLVEAMPFGMYLGREPIAEAAEMVGSGRVLRVDLPARES